MLELLKNLKTMIEVRIVVFLLESTEPVRLKDIHESLNINRKHCREPFKTSTEQ